MQETLEQFQSILARRADRVLPLPNVIGVGSGRAGTSSLFGLLNACPDVFTSPIKELNFFGVNQAPFRRNGWTLADYATFFMGGESFVYRAEISPVYLTEPMSLSMIANGLPSAKIIITLREPLSRFLSQYKLHAPGHGFTDVNAYAAHALERLPRMRAQPPWYAPQCNLRASLYGCRVSECFDLFGDQNCLVLFFEELNEPAAWQRALEGFLRVPVPPVTERFRNQSEATELGLSSEMRTRLTELFEQDFAFLPEVVAWRAAQLWNCKTENVAVA